MRFCENILHLNYNKSHFMNKTAQPQNPSDLKETLQPIFITSPVRHKMF